METYAAQISRKLESYHNATCMA